VTRSIAEQTVEELGGLGSVLVRQRDDHRELDRLLHELDTTTGPAQDTVLRRINRLVFSHAFAEETVLWPLLRKVLPDGEALTLRVEEEHQQVNELVAELDRIDAHDPRRPELLGRLARVLREDVRDEEDVLFPGLQGQLDAQELRRLGRQWAVARRISPTPHTPPSPVAHRATRSPACRCRCSTVPATFSTAASTERPRPLTPPGRAASRGVAALAGVIERVPGFRSGERAPISR
jgi:hemerythrin superfamily protein